MDKRSFENYLREKSMYRSAIIDIHKLRAAGVSLDKLLYDNRKAERQDG